MTRNRGCKVMCQCGRTTQSFDGVCLACQKAAKSNVARRCENCERNAIARSAYCRPCRRDLTRLTAEDLLTDGQWVRHGLVMAWEATTAEVPEPKPMPSFVPWIHGTERGYQRHRRHRDNWPLPADDPCGCKAAHRAHEAMRVAMRDRPEMREAS